jgi:hypothetical protein
MDIAFVGVLHGSVGIHTRKYADGRSSQRQGIRSMAMQEHLVMEQFEWFSAINVSVDFPASNALDELVASWVVGQHLVDVIDFVGENEVVLAYFG